MKKSTKVILSILAGVLVLAVVLMFLNNFAEKKLRQGLEEAMVKINLNYEDVNVNLLGRKAEISEPSFNFKGKSFTAKSLTVNNISIMEYINNKNIEIGEVVLQGPNFKIDQSKADSENGENKNSEFEENILVKNLRIENGDVAVIQSDSVENSMYAKFSDLSLDDFAINKETMEQPIPFNYENYSFKGDSLFYSLDSRHNITAGTVEINNGKSVFKDLRIIPIFSKQEFQQHIPYELDHFTMNIEEVNLSNLQWEVENDTLKFENSLTEINGLNLEVYRDKVQASEDLRQKKMYSEAIRDLPIKIKLDTIRFSNAYIAYEEKVDAKRPPGTVDFGNLNASIYNISNVNMDAEDFPKTEVVVETSFMQEANLNVNWKFDIRDKADAFTISGNMDYISEESMNRFMKPALNVESKGAINDMAFNFGGNNTQAQGDMKLIYEDFKVEVLRKDGSRKNKVLSALANLIIKNDAKSEDIQQEDIQVTRNKTKSFWNFLWLCIREGALKSFL